MSSEHPCQKANSPIVWGREDKEDITTKIISAARLSETFCVLKHFVF